MNDGSYKQLCEEMAKRGGRYPGKDIPEFYDLVKELFTHDEAAVAAAMTTRPASAAMIAREMGKEEKDIAPILEALAPLFHQGWHTLLHRCSFCPGHI
jgi:hypothetical protein